MRMRESTRDPDFSADISCIRDICGEIMLLELQRLVLSLVMCTDGSSDTRFQVEMHFNGFHWN